MSMGERMRRWRAVRAMTRALNGDDTDKVIFAGLTTVGVGCVVEAVLLQETGLSR
jgi:hypothetical protein